MRIVLFCLALIGCGGQTEPTKTLIPIPDEQPKPIHHTPIVSQLAVKTCDVKQLNKLDDCLLYTLLCDDDSTEYYLSCSTKPIGVITNPPDPIVE